MTPIHVWLAKATTGEKAFDMDPVAALRVLQVNAIGPALVSQAYAPFLEIPGRRGVIMHISSSLGAFSMGKISPTVPSYSMSKAALNMLVRSFAYARSSTALD